MHGSDAALRLHVALRPRRRPPPAARRPLQALECLFRRRWNRLDGLGALLVSPTRELAVQIFEELRRVGRGHELSAGLLIGGSDVGEEAERVAGMNILVATPGRLLQHMDETPGFDAGEVQVLVLDEADRILDMVRRRGGVGVGVA
jgi:ATP-dependent RNA helicase DDX10/DBP4